MPDVLPPPPVPAHYDLRNFPDMPLEVARLRDSSLRRCSSGDEFKAAIVLWCAAWHQVPAGSLPDDDVELADLAAFGGGRSAVRAFQKVKQMAMRGWYLADDGRWYHERLAAKVTMAWKAKQLQKERTFKARLASLVKALEKETDQGRRAVLQGEHDRLLADMSQALSQGASQAMSQPPREGIGSEGIGRDRIGRDGVGGGAAPAPPTPSGRSILEKALRSRGLRCNEQAVREWGDFLQGACRIASPQEAPRALDLLIALGKDAKVTVAYYHHAAPFADQVAADLREERESNYTNTGDAS